MKHLIVVLFLFQLVCAKLEWRFWGHFGGIYLEDVLVGTPGQKITPNLDIYNDRCPGLWIQSQFNSPTGFKFKKSTTFNEQDDLYNSIFGYEDLWINSKNGTKQELKETSINVVDRPGYCTSDYSFLALSPANSYIKNNFLDSVIEKGEDQVVVMQYDNITTNWRSNSTGLLTFGSVPSGCQRAWVYPPQVKPIDYNYPIWNVQLDKLTAGNYTMDKPAQAVFDFSSSVIQMPYDVYDKVQIALGSKPSSGGLVSCSNEAEMTFMIGGIYLTLKYDDLFDRGSGTPCDFNGRSSDSDLFVLPFTLFRNKCIMFDYRNGGQIGFSAPLSSTTTTINVFESTSFKEPKIEKIASSLSTNKDLTTQSTLSNFQNNKIEQTTSLIETEKAFATKKLCHLLIILTSLLTNLSL